MPSKSKAQKRLMAAVANSPKFAKKVGVPQSVGREFANADKRNKDMPSKYNSTANKPGKAVKKGYARGGTAHAKKVLRNLDDEDYRIRNRTGGNTAAERRRINREKEFEVSHMKKGGKVQGYDARQDESLGARNKTKGQQNLKSRRHEAAAMEKHGGKRKYSDVSTMDKGVVKKKRGGKIVKKDTGGVIKKRGKYVGQKGGPSEAVIQRMNVPESVKKAQRHPSIYERGFFPVSPAEQIARVDKGERGPKSGSRRFDEGGEIKTKKAKNIDGIASKGRTKGRFV